MMASSESQGVLKQQLLAARDEFDEFRRESAELEGALEEELEQSQAEVKRLRSRLEAVTDALSKAEEGSDRSGAEVVALQTEIRDRLAEDRGLRARVRDLEQDKDDLERRCRVLASQLENVQSRLEEAEEELWLAREEADAAAEARARAGEGGESVACESVACESEGGGRGSTQSLASAASSTAPPSELPVLEVVRPAAHSPPPPPRGGRRASALSTLYSLGAARTASRRASLPRDGAFGPDDVRRTFSRRQQDALLWRVAGGQAEAATIAQKWRLLAARRRSVVRRMRAVEAVAATANAPTPASPRGQHHRRCVSAIVFRLACAAGDDPPARRHRCLQ